ncbi:hypothetical protein C8F01DRAFT_274941 [Mycena amicta]|nr:hypothetical protein C8F01DRAFT_274941 [Mycena amicta]
MSSTKSPSTAARYCSVSSARRGWRGPGTMVYLVRLVRVHRDTSWKPAFRSGTVPCNSFLPSFLPREPSPHRTRIIVTLARDVRHRPGVAVPAEKEKQVLELPAETDAEENSTQSQLQVQVVKFAFGLKSGTLPPMSLAEALPITLHPPPPPAMRGRYVYPTLSWWTRSRLCPPTGVCLCCCRSQWIWTGYLRVSNTAFRRRLHSPVGQSPKRRWPTAHRLVSRR